MTYRAVIFDLWETLLRAVPTGTRSQAFALAAQAGFAEADLLRGWSSTWEGATRGTLRCIRDRVEVMLRSAGALELDPALVDELVGLLHVRYRPYLFSDVRGALAEVRARGYRLGLISNMSYDEYQALALYELPSLVDALVISCDEGLAKPEVAIFELAAARLGVPAAECLFVDDTPSYLAGAREAGLTTVQITRAATRETTEQDDGAAAHITGLRELLAWLPGRAAP